MRKFDRAEEPDVLAANWVQWGLKWEKDHQAGAKFYWHQVASQGVNEIILSTLKLQTIDHCSFCEAHPVAPPSDDTIEHFKPKASHPRDAYKWDNLYYCCRFCQRKEGEFSDDILKPDAADYQFDRYFMWDHTTGDLKAKPSASPDDQRKATATISYFRLNFEHPRLRRLNFRRRLKLLDDPLDEFAYRSFLEAIPS